MSLLLKCCQTKPWMLGFEKMYEIPPFVFVELWGLKLRLYGPFCAKSVCAFLHLSSPQRSLGCESHRLEVSGPGGVRCVRSPVEGRGAFPVSTHSIHKKPHDFHSKKGCIHFKVLFASPSKPAPFFSNGVIGPFNILFYQLLPYAWWPCGAIETTPSTFL